MRRIGVDVSGYQPNDVSGYGQAFTGIKISELQAGHRYPNMRLAGQLATARGPVFGYFFAHFGGNTTLAIQEATYALSLAGSFPKGAWLFVDYEVDASPDRNANTMATLTAMDLIKREGFRPGVYGNRSNLSTLDLDAITKIYGDCLWIAGYPYSGSDGPDFRYFPSIAHAILWQFDDNYKRMGVDASVELIPGVLDYKKAPISAPAQKVVKDTPAIATFKRYNGAFTRKSAFKLDQVKFVDGIWQGVSYKLAGGKDFDWTKNGIPLAILDNLSGTPWSTKAGDLMRYESSFSYGTIDAYDPASDGVMIKEGVYGPVWYDAQALLDM